MKEVTDPLKEGGDCTHLNACEEGARREPSEKQGSRYGEKEMTGKVKEARDEKIVV
jgi:hypothetical protein